MSMTHYPHTSLESLAKAKAMSTFSAYSENKLPAELLSHITPKLVYRKKEEKVWSSL